MRFSQWSKGKDEFRSGWLCCHVAEHGIVGGLVQVHADAEPREARRCPALESFRLQTIGEVLACEIDGDERRIRGFGDLRGHQTLPLVVLRRALIHFEDLKVGDRGRLAVRKGVVPGAQDHVLADAAPDRRE